MSAFEERKRGSESQFTLDAQKEFKTEARRNKKLALWAAELMGKQGEDVNTYVLEVIASDMEEAGDDDVYRKLKTDLDAAGVEINEAGIRSKMANMLAEARAEIYG